jgi:uncharacterized protein YciI
VLYVITGRDATGSLPIRRRVRADHLVHIRELVDAGRVVLAGPCPALDTADPGEAGYSGSVIVAEFASLDEARAWIAADPYVTEGVFESHEVRPFLKVLP